MKMSLMKARPSLNIGIIAVSLCLTIVMSPTPARAGADPKASALLKQVLAAQNRVNAVTCTLKLSQQDGTNSDSATLTFAYRKPQWVKATLSGSTGPLLTGTSNGKRILLYAPVDKKYVQRAVPAGESGADMISTASQSKIMRAYVRPQALIDSLTAAEANTRYVGTANVSGVPVDIVQVQYTDPSGMDLTVSCSFGRKDHLLRALAMTQVSTEGGTPRESRIDEVVSRLSLSPKLTATDFVISNPRGASELTTADADNGMYDPSLKPGATPIPIDTVDIDGKRVSLAQYRGKVLLIDFWASWCGPCMMEMPNVLDAYKKYHSQGLEVVGFSQDQDLSSLKSTMAEHGIPWRMVFCGAPGGDKVPLAYGIQAIPFMVLVGRDGKIAAVDLRGPEIAEAVKAALAK